MVVQSVHSASEYIPRGTELSVSGGSPVSPTPPRAHGHRAVAAVEPRAYVACRKKRGEPSSFFRHFFGDGSVSRSYAHLLRSRRYVDLPEGNGSLGAESCAVAPARPPRRAAAPRVSPVGCRVGEAWMGGLHLHHLVSSPVASPCLAAVVRHPAGPDARAAFRSFGRSCRYGLLGRVVRNASIGRFAGTAAVGEERSG